MKPVKYWFVVRAVRKVGRVIRRQWRHLVYRQQYASFSKTLSEELPESQFLIVIESMPWHHITKQRPHHLATCLRDLGATILYVNRGFHIPTKDSERIYIVDDQMYFRELVQAFTGPKYFWLFSPTPVPPKVVKEFMSYGLRVIYDHIDEFHETITGEVHSQLANYNNLPSISPKLLIASADLLFAALRERFPVRPPILLLPNAVDANVFNHAKYPRTLPPPEDLDAIVKLGRPIVGYYGMMAPWLDYTLLNKLAQQMKDFEFIFIGPDYMKGIRALKGAQNVHCLGPKPYLDLPGYAAHFDCAIIPFERGEIAKSTSPVKLFEYMAMGLPTVCTADLRECEGFDHVLMSADDAQFAENIEKAIQLRKNPEVVARLIEQGKANTWQARAQAVYDELARIERADC
jgi:glycosyltransferase involved in cell wall biosynthesis